MHSNYLDKYIDKFDEFMAGGKVRINTKIEESGDVLPVRLSIAFFNFYMELIDDSYNPETFKTNHPWCKPLDMKKFRCGCTLLMYDVFMSSKELMKYEQFLTTCIDKMSETFWDTNMHSIPVVISDGTGNWDETISIYALVRMHYELMQFRSEQSANWTAEEQMRTQQRTRVYEHANGNMTLRSLPLRP